MSKKQEHIVEIEDVGMEKERKMIFEWKSRFIKENPIIRQ